MKLKFSTHLSCSVPALKTNGRRLNEKGSSLEIDSDSRGCPVEPEFTLLSSFASSLFQVILRLVSSQASNYPILSAFVTVLKNAIMSHSVFVLNGLKLIFELKAFLSVLTKK